MGECIMISHEEFLSYSEKMKEERRKQLMKLKLEKYYSLSDHLDGGYRPKPKE